MAKPRAQKAGSWEERCLPPSKALQTPWDLACDLQLGTSRYTDQSQLPYELKRNVDLLMFLLNLVIIVIIIARVAVKRHSTVFFLSPAS